MNTVNGHPNAKSIGTHLRAVRQAKAWTLDEVVTRSGGEFRATSLSAYERGERMISMARLLRLAAVYGVEPAALLPSAEVPAPEVCVELDPRDPAAVRGRLLVRVGAHEVRVEDLDLRQLRRSIDRTLRGEPAPTPEHLSLFDAGGAS